MCSCYGLVCVFCCVSLCVIMCVRVRFMLLLLSRMCLLMVM